MTLRRALNELFAPPPPQPVRYLAPSPRQRLPIPPRAAGRATFGNSPVYFSVPKVGTVWELQGFQITPQAYPVTTGTILVLLRRSGTVIDSFEWDGTSTDSVGVPVQHLYPIGFKVFDTHDLSLESPSGTVTVDYNATTAYL